MTEPGSLEAALKDIRACRVCAPEFGREPRPVIRVRSETRILICGQAPGRRVHESGLPFDDPSGERLRQWMGIDCATFHGHPSIGFAGMAFCFPGTDRHGGDIPPPTRCAALWRRRLLALLPKVELTLLLGRPAQLWTLGSAAGASMGETVRNWRDRLPDIFVAPHPSWRNISWLRRNPWFEAEATSWLQSRVEELLAA